MEPSIFKKKVLSISLKLKIVGIKWCDSGGTDNPWTTHGRTTGEPRRTVSGYIKICGAPSGEPRGNHGESVWVITPLKLFLSKKR